MSDIEVWFDDPVGNRLALVSGAVSVGVARVANGVGAVAVAIGQPQGLPVQLDGLIEIWRRPTTDDLTPGPFPAGKGSLKLMTVGLMRKFVWQDDEKGVQTVVVSGPDAKDLLARRIVAFAAGTSQAQKHDYADDMLKEIVTQALGSTAGTGRNLTALNFAVDPDLSNGPTMTKGFAWRNVLRVCQDICQASAEAGTDLFFEVVPGLVNSPGTADRMGFTFKTFTGQIGVDRTVSPTGGLPDQVVFGREFGNLEGAVLEEDYSGEVNYVYAGGQGEESARLIEEAQDSVRVKRSPWNRREGFVDARSDALEAGLLAAARRGLVDGRPVTRFSGKLVDTDATAFGRDWDYGDKVMCKHQGREFEGMVRAVKWTIDSGGRENVEARVDVTV